MLLYVVTDKDVAYSPEMGPYQGRVFRELYEAESYSRLHNTPVVEVQTDLVERSMVRDAWDAAVEFMEGEFHELLNRLKDKADYTEASVEFDTDAILADLARFGLEEAIQGHYSVEGGTNLDNLECEAQEGLRDILRSGKEEFAHWEENYP